MNHEELLAKIDHMWNDDFDYVTEKNRKALRAVMELHQPLKIDANWCNCDNPYPCLTIQTIEKELN